MNALPAPKLIVCTSVRYWPSCCVKASDDGVDAGCNVFSFSARNLKRFSDSGKISWNVLCKCHIWPIRLRQFQAKFWNFRNTCFQSFRIVQVKLKVIYLSLIVLFFDFLLNRSLLNCSLALTFTNHLNFCFYFSKNQYAFLCLLLKSNITERNVTVWRPSVCLCVS